MRIGLAPRMTFLVHQEATIEAKQSAYTPHQDSSPCVVTLLQVLFRLVLHNVEKLACMLMHEHFAQLCDIYH